MKVSRCILLTMGLLVSLGCHAQSSIKTNLQPVKKNFIGLGLGESLIEPEEKVSAQDYFQKVEERKKKFWNVYTGHKFSENFSIKAEYVKLANWDGTRIGAPDVKIRAISLSALGFYPLTGRLSVFGEGGVYTYRSKETFGSGNATNTIKDRGTKPFWGGGIQYNLGRNTDLILKYNDYGKVKNSYSQSSIRQVALNVQYKF